MKKKERKQTTQGRDGRTVRRHHTGILGENSFFLIPTPFLFCDHRIETSRERERDSLRIEESQAREPPYVDGSKIESCVRERERF